ncbi:hypothetical protein [Actinotalea sp. C106]|uniref:hypothetical protein n=1 Tax=Actinotalea sp. C106 TaxID=2908644 RepID=UPI002027E1EE|nr:hypothetical protein [Actinotalea sp. C106]
MAQITAPGPVHDDRARTDQITRDRLRTAVPVAVAVALLFGTLWVGALALRDMVDLGVWLLSST